MRYEVKRVRDWGSWLRRVVKCGKRLAGHESGGEIFHYTKLIIDPVLIVKDAELDGLAHTVASHNRRVQNNGQQVFLAKPELQFE